MFHLIDEHINTTLINMAPSTYFVLLFIIVFVLHWRAQKWKGGGVGGVSLVRP